MKKDIKALKRIRHLKCKLCECNTQLEEALCQDISIPVYDGETLLGTYVGNTCDEDLSIDIQDLSSEITYNFIVSADWSGNGVTDEASFLAFLLSVSDYPTINISDFTFEGNQISCNVSATGGTGIGLTLLSITEVLAIGQGWENMSVILLDDNSITNFDLILPLPSTLTSLILNNNSLTEWSMLLPLGLEVLDISFNSFSDWSLSEAWATAQSSFTTGCEIQTDDCLAPAIGTNFETIINTKNATVTV